MFHKLPLIMLLLVFFLIPLSIGAQNETPANAPNVQPTATTAPNIQPNPAPLATPTPKPVRRTPVSLGEEPEEKPLYMNVAVYVGGGCFLVVFIGLYMILSSSPSPRSKRRKKS